MVEEKNRAEEIRSRVKLLSDDPKGLLRKLVKLGKKTVSLKELEAAGVDSLRSALFALYELESRHFGVVSGDGVDSTFTFNTSILNLLTRHNLA